MEEEGTSEGGMGDREGIGEGRTDGGKGEWRRERCKDE